MKASQEIVDCHAFLYRVGKRNGGDGLWYDNDGNYTGHIHELSDGSVAALPMGSNPIFRSDDYHWISTTNSIDNLRFWFSEQDMIELLAKDYEVLKIEVSGYRRFSFDCEMPYSHEVYSDHQVIHIETIDPGILYSKLAAVF